LRFINSLKDSSLGLLYRWSLQIQGFDFELKYQKGSTHIVAYCLSRRDYLECTDDTMDKLFLEQSIHTVKRACNNPCVHVTVLRSGECVSKTENGENNTFIPNTQSFREAFKSDSQSKDSTMAGSQAYVFTTESHKEERDSWLQVIRDFLLCVIRKSGAVPVETCSSGENRGIASIRFEVYDELGDLT